jgi:hypothetical protein
MTAARKPTVEEAVLSQSLADMHRAEGGLAQADAMDEAALEVLDPMAHVTGPITIGRAAANSYQVRLSQFSMISEGSSAT